MYAYLLRVGQESLALPLRSFSSPYQFFLISGQPRFQRPQLISCRKRAFHQSPSRPIYNEVIQTTYTVFQSVHSINGISWSLSIPLVALLSRIFVSLPIAIFQQKASARRVKLVPILLAWRHSFRKEIYRELGDKGPIICQRRLNSQMCKKTKELLRRHRCGRWKIFMGSIQIPIFFVALDTLRRMANLELSSLTKLFNPEKMADNQAIVPIEPGLRTEGILWFPNLLEPDPQLILPFMLSGVMILNIFGSRKSALPLSKWQTRIQRGAGVAALSVGPFLINTPSVLLLYWISNSILSWIEAQFVSWLIPISPPVKPLITKGTTRKKELDATALGEKKEEKKG
ncbi:Cytochrome c oxidase assembly protein COX18, mitochondrial [Golovinomyces cichoracearum]|uniref:Cytochrome c oxidase assembly protein COX18, mitochondrial n=1 Tax=Golovinomyces cichoracearum TaxID=62708 RepID=A0A420IAP8_9PEZI|nr:Cytochrome c oxidase assembly protein COX18, mitochondrial [Golovinomyces cichoracearum]